MSNEQRYFDALKIIATAHSFDWLQRNAERKYGVSPNEALEMAHENIVNVAQYAIKGKRRPKG